MHTFFQEFGERQSVGDGTVVVEIIRVGIGFLEDWRDLTNLQTVWNGPLCKGGIDDLCPEGEERE